MMPRDDMDIRKLTGKMPSVLPTLLCAVLLAACGGGGGQSADPVVLDVPIAYVKRTLETGPQGMALQADVRQLGAYAAGGDVYVRDRATASTDERNITRRLTGGLGDVRDLEVSYDGSKLLFALRLPDIEGADPEEQPTWNIWEYEFASDTLRRIIADDLIAEAGEDVAPHYLPDGRIVFTSTRQRQSGAILLDEDRGRPQFPAQTESLTGPAFVLHVMESDGSDIRQISFNQSHDFDPTVVASGEIVFSRWENMGGRNEIHLYRVRPDGTELELLYGARSHRTSDGATVQFLRPRPMPDGRLLALLAPFAGTFGGGDLAVIDVDHYADNTIALPPNHGMLSGPAQQRGTHQEVNVAPGISTGGRFRSAFPLWDGSDRLLVSWSPCRLDVQGRLLPCTPERLRNANAEEAPPLYGIWIYDRTTRTQLPIVAPQEGVIFDEIVAAQPRQLPQVLFDKRTGDGLDAELEGLGLGQIHIRSVYDVDGREVEPIREMRDPALTAASERPARFLRIVKAAAIPGREVRDVPGTSFGVSRQQLMREIIGYVPIEPDGSVLARVPANVPFAIEVLDADGRRVAGPMGGRHRSWLQVRAGETITCNGCHQAGSDYPHGRSGFEPLNPGAPTNLPFANTEPDLVADMGETMAQLRARQARLDPQLGTARMSDGATPSVDLVFEDVWTDPAGRAKDGPFSYLYDDLPFDVVEKKLVTESCLPRWSGTCRIVNNYPEHIHPLWSVPRQVLDEGDGAVLADHTCIRCHATAGGTAEPKGQLDLDDGLSPDEPAHLRSYRELLAVRAERELDEEGVLRQKLVQALDEQGGPVYVTDGEGEPILDENGERIPVMVPVLRPPSMSPSGARYGRFMNLFNAGGSHAGWLSAAELRLMSEWLDIGAQYYNDPFKPEE